jgi:beta-lactamase regulating signal transducer with metallopeptidase domain
MQPLPLADAFNHFAQSAAPAAVTSSWQGLAVAAALALGLRLAPRISAAQRFLVSLAGFAVVVALPFLPALAAHPAAQLSSPTPTALFQLDPRWMQAIAALWLAASLYRAVDLAVHSLRLRRLWRTATPVPCAGQASASVRDVQVCTTQQLDRPSVIGFFAPRILIPDWLFARLSSDELNQIVLHESQHLRRRDDWTNLAQKLCLVVFPLNPALVWIDRRLAREREMACDEAVVRATRAPRAYAACLASLAERGLARQTEALRTEALSLGAFERRPELIHRVHSILRSRRALHPIAARTIFAGLACGLGLLSFELARCPRLVAFASPAKPVQIAQSGLADAVYTPRPRLSAQFRAVPAKAVMPIIPAQPIARRNPALRRTPAIAQPVSAPDGREILAQTQAPAAQPQAQWVVFTEWEQIETTQSSAEPAAATGTRAASQQPDADYESSQLAGANATAPAGADTAPPPQPTARIRVTQLVLRMLPASSNSSQPARHWYLGGPSAIRLGNGWLVIQL